jgi:hypothetical protein
MPTPRETTQEEIQAAIRNSTNKNIFLTKKNTTRRLKENLKQSTLTPLVFQSQSVMTRNTQMSTTLNDSTTT